MVIKSTLRERQKDNTSGKTDTDINFLNSFYLDDLDRLIRETDRGSSLGKALEQYLGPASSIETRQDILRQPQAMAACVAPAKLTRGRWPAPSKHHLMLAQQAAVAEIVSRLNDSAGLVAVNGPPGTGKTTLLCDVVADVVVRRALSLSKLGSPRDAFGKEITIGGMNVFPLKPEIVAGTGIVVTSNNNAAVENITRELPALAKIANEEHGGAAYFQEVAAQVFVAADIKAPAWGLIAAALGNSVNRRKFANAFFRESKRQTFVPGQSCDIKTVLETPPGDSLVRWKTAKEEFLTLLEQVDHTRRRFQKVSDAFIQLASLSHQMTKTHQQVETTYDELKALPDKWAAQLQGAESALSNSKASLAEAAEAEQLAKLTLQSASDRLRATEIELVPRLWDRCLKVLGVRTSRMQAWENAMRELPVVRANASEALREALKVLNRCRQVNGQHEKVLDELNTRQQRKKTDLEAKLKFLEQQLRQDHQRHLQYEEQVKAFKVTGATVPDEAFFSLEAANRHLASVWVDPDFDLLRARLFLAALRLHEATMLACNGKAIANLRAVKGMLSQDMSEPIGEDQRGLLWDMLFFTVPVVSSTLASFDRLFVDLGRESLGWLLIDEAGQATPQSVAGALWRSRRAVIIGDPLQIEPVMTVPSALVLELRNRHGVNVIWSPSKESAQTLADRTMVLGAWIGDARMPETAVWTGMPLRAHRRCIDPMFSVANDIAYAGQMVQANVKPSTFNCLLGESTWFDVRGLSNNDQVVHEEMTCLIALLRQLKVEWPTTDKGVPASLFVISPFRKVADECWAAFRRAGIDSKNKDRRVDCGTVHRFQGKEADIVLIVLGSAPGKEGSGSRNWASSKPNLLNVALTRAKMRVYVIGNVENWASFSIYNALVNKIHLTTASATSLMVTD